ncbi:LysR family transcriptional regulator [Vibrio navarrensis]|uniref:LysR family transcriptional regulator n=1 Tax=Vibrio navarrensis TaxID=29495 RepID=UPI00186A8D73|nr:LysR family transcriptional regulator [Vibrio navarrensis]EJL6394659.1 LysR family transcriptional regulator [Vibrio navarrensis]EKA5635166.1 LysR family transcriptional regulator [Vibrio navarrensis]MBE4619372.1 LysR family transcriptional regulator [Vibrio navarrensis]
MLRDYDLNLLTVFDAVMTLGSVSKAAEKLNMTSAAVSQNLARLREQIGEPLFVRQGRGLQPTQHAFNMHKHISQGLSAIRFGLETDASFDPATSKREFVIGGHTYFDLAVLPQLLQRVGQIAPDITVNLKSYEDNHFTPSQVLSEREADLFLSSLPISHPSIITLQAAQEELVVVYAQNHPRLSGTLTKEQFFAEKHTALNSRRFGNYMFSSLVEQALPTRKIHYQSDSMLNLMATAAMTDLLCFTPKRLADMWADKFGLQIQPLPFEIRSVPTFICWHKAKQQDKGLIWLREQIEDILSQ